MVTNFSSIAVCSLSSSSVLVLVSPGLSVNGMQLHSHIPTHASIYLDVQSLHVQNFIWRVNSMPTLQKVCSVNLLQIIYLPLHIKLNFPFVEIHCIIKYLEVNTSRWATHKNTWAQQMWSHKADTTFHRTCQNNSVLYDILSLHKWNSIYITLHYFVSQLFT